MKGEFKIVTHVETLEKLKEIDLKLFDGIYLGDPTCTEYPTNLAINKEHLRIAVDILKEYGVEAYGCTYAVPRNRHLGKVEEMVAYMLDIGVDAIEAHNMGVLRHISRLDRGVPVFMGYFSNIYTHETVKILERYGVRRVFLNPELSLEEIQYINEHTNAEIIVFTHGKLPLGISETCFIKEYAPVSCEDVCEGMWLTSGKWRLKNIGFAIFSGKDWSILEYLGTFYYRGFKIFYIQGLRETPEYINSISAIYKRALERVASGENNYIDESWISEISRLCPNGLCNGYLFRRAGHRYIGRFFNGERIYEAERGERHEAR